MYFKNQTAIEYMGVRRYFSQGVTQYKWAPKKKKSR